MEKDNSCGEEVGMGQEEEDGRKPREKKKVRQGKKQMWERSQDTGAT